MNVIEITLLFFGLVSMYYVIKLKRLMNTGTVSKFHQEEANRCVNKNFEIDQEWLDKTYGEERSTGLALIKQPNGKYSLIATGKLQDTSWC